MSRARTVLVAGTASHVGKSTVAAGLCRLLADRGVSVAPFKAQNMSNNARVVPVADAEGDDAHVNDEEYRTGAWGEIGVSQYVQARAARISPTTDHNPVLLKPRGGGESQLVVDGRALDSVAAGDYYERHWERARRAAADAHRRLTQAYDVVIAEGAGSIAEINLHHRDLANVETVRFARGESGENADDTRLNGGNRPDREQPVDVILVADVDRGGVFASLVGTLELLPEDVRECVVGLVVTKFRGDVSILEPGLETLEARTGVPILGVLPYDDPGLPAEDSLSLPPAGETLVVGDDDGIGDADRTVTVAVPRLPRASNVTDVEPLARTPGVRIAFVPLSDPLDGSAGIDADAIVLTGTKNTVDDAVEAADAGLFEALGQFDGPVVGLCGGYQLLGESLRGAVHEGTEDRERVSGAGLLPVVTHFSPGKTVEPVERVLEGCGPLAGAQGSVSGYEIRLGETRPTGPVDRPFEDDGAAVGDVLGTYLHGLFENRIACEAFVDRVYVSAGHERPPGSRDDDSPYDRAAALVGSLDLDPLGWPFVDDGPN